MTPWIVLATIVGYFALLFIISWAASRKSDTNTALTGGRQAPWFIVAIAMIGAPISGVTFVSVPGQVAVKSFSYMQMVLGFAVGYFVIAYVLMPLFFKRPFTATWSSDLAQARTRPVHGSSSSARCWGPRYASMWCV